MSYLSNRYVLVIVLLLTLLPNQLSIAARKSNEIYGEHQPIEQIEFREITVGDALRILSEQSMLNIVASKKAADIPITMYLRHVTPMQVLDAIAKTYNLWYQRDDNSNIVRLYTVAEYRSEQVEFKKEETEIFTMKNAKNALDLADTIQNLFSTRVRLSYGRNQQEILNDLAQRFARFDMIDSRTTQNFSSGSSSSGSNSGSSSSGSNSSSGSRSGSTGSTGSTGSMGNTGQTGQQSNFGSPTGQQNLLNPQNKDDPTNINKFATEILSGDSEDTEAIVDTRQRHQSPIYVGVIKHQNRVLVRTRDNDAMNEIRKIKKRLDLESSMLLMEVKVLSIDLSDGYESLFDFRVKSGDVTVSSNNAVRSIGATELLDSGIRTAVSATNPALLATVLSDHFAMRLQLMEKENRVTELATPILLTSNQEVSRFFVGSEVPILTGVTAGTATIGSSVTPSVTTQPTANYTQRKIGNTLLLTPNINADNTVSINILIEQSHLNKNGATILVPTGSFDGTGLTEQNIDIVDEQTFSGSVIAKDNTTVAVGGLIDEAAGNRENKVPVLGDVPVLGFFFDDVLKSRKRTELVVLIKPHIISSPEEAQRISQGMLNKNSINPTLPDAESMDIYSNDSKQFKGYELEQPYREYHLQDKLNEQYNAPTYKPAPVLPNPPAPNSQSNTDKQTYMELTRYAAENVRLPADQRRLDNYISPSMLTQTFPVSILYDPRIKTTPVASWQKNDIYVTALELKNSAKENVTVDYRHLKGNWLAATCEKELLKPNETTYLYLISSQPFEQKFASVNQ